MDNIQYTITINQYAVLANGFDLDIVDMAIFDFIKNFAHVEKCVKLSDESGTWFWVSHAMIIRQLPILGIQSEQGIANHVRKLIAAGLLVRHPDCERLRRTFYRFGPAYESLVFASPQKVEKAPNNFGGTPNETLGITPNENWGYNNKEIYNYKKDNTSVYGDTHFFEPEKNSINGTSHSVNTEKKEKVCAEKESDTVAVEVVEVRSRARTARFVPPTVAEVAEYCRQRGNDIDPEHFVAAYQQSGWRLKGGAPMKDWRAAVITWEKYRKHNKNNGNNGESRNYDNDKGVRDAEFARYWAGRVGDKLV